MNLLTVLYIDDAGIAAPEAKYIDDEFITWLFGNQWIDPDKGRHFQ
jgi:hypothetical protein